MTHEDALNFILANSLVEAQSEKDVYLCRLSDISDTFVVKAKLVSTVNKIQYKIISVDMEEG